MSSGETKRNRYLEKEKKTKKNPGEVLLQLGIKAGVRTKSCLITILIVVQAESVLGSSCPKEWSHLDSEVVGGMTTSMLKDKIEKIKPES